jgi:hypothetical protein
MSEETKQNWSGYWAKLTVPEKLAWGAMRTLGFCIKWVEYVIGWPLLRIAAKGASDSDLLALAQTLAQPDMMKSKAVRRLWGRKLMEQASAVAAEGGVSKPFREAYTKRFPYVVVFGPRLPTTKGPSQR